LQKIGEGGLGLVYMAEQEEPVRRRVALKVIRLGMDTQSVIARFEAERQALAMMDHPNIAKILDGGVTETGRPYFVMDLVQGLPITQFCDEAKLSTRGRLDLFREVCSAIQHAHQKGIIHRDIKPSNILVTLHGEKPVPKVIDFGIAKATQQRLTDKTLFTQFQQFLGTPAYVSPEQATLSGLDVDTRSDIYSLGVLLYELLTGKTPFDSKELLQAGLDEMRRTICEKEPARPSTRVSALRGDELTTTAQRRGIEPPKLISLLRGDLDWIVMKCLEKDRARRYESTNGLATDIQRHLTNEPVVASPPRRFYRLQKLVRRNRGVFAALGIILLVLVLGVGISTWEAFRARRAEQQQGLLRRQAQTEATKSQQVAKFLEDMLQSVGPSKARGRDASMLREILDETAKRIGNELTNQPEVEMQLRDTLGNTYEELGLYQQMAAMAQTNLRLARAHGGEENVGAAKALEQLGRAQTGLGNYDKAQRLVREALTMRRKLLGNEQEEVADYLNTFGMVLEDQRKLPEAEAAYREALAILRKLVGKEHPRIAATLGNLGGVLFSEGKLTEAEPVIREGLAMRRKLWGDEHPDAIKLVDTLALLLSAQGKTPEAEAMFRETLVLRRKLHGNDHPEVAHALWGVATMLYRQEKYAEAEPIIREGLALQRKLLGDGHPDLAYSLELFGNVLLGEHKLTEAEEVLREDLTIKRRELGNDHPDLGAPLNTLAIVFFLEDKLSEAEEVSREAVAILRKHSDDATSKQLFNLVAGMYHLADLLRHRQALAEARPLAEEAFGLYQNHPEWSQKERQHVVRILEGVLIAMGDSRGMALVYCEQLQDMRPRLTTDDPALAGMLAKLTGALLADERFTEAESAARECLAIREKKLPDDWSTFSIQSMLGASLLGQKRYAEAEPLLLRGYVGMKQREARIRGPDQLLLKKALQNLSKLYEATSRPEQAAEWKKKLEEFEQSQTTDPSAPSAAKSQP
jgi:tetratricopeptide (TPR) repeat protein